MKLLFKLGHWHALAKLRMHTESSVAELEKATEELGKLMREFCNKSASTFSTFELPREQQARARRQERVNAQRQSAPQGECQTQTTQTRQVPSQASRKPSGRKRKQLNLFTYKWHALGDYPSTIRHVSTTDNYSTQMVCSFSHCFLIVLLKYLIG
jgi:hypothetical protein